jgi:hypothetical protein
MYDNETKQNSFRQTRPKGIPLALGIIQLWDSIEVHQPVSPDHTSGSLKEFLTRNFKQGQKEVRVVTCQALLWDAGRKLCLLKRQLHGTFLKKHFSNSVSQGLSYQWHNYVYPWYEPPLQCSHTHTQEIA